MEENSIHYMRVLSWEQSLKTLLIERGSIKQSYFLQNNKPWMVKYTHL